MLSKLKSLPLYNRAVLPYHFIKSWLARLIYGFPSRKLRVIAVTGTNGKTSTCFIIWQMLRTAGFKTGLMTTVAWGTEQLHPQYEHMTTVDVFTLNHRIRTIANSGAEFLVLEVTSHAIAQFRTLGIPIEIAVFTNLTHDHLDYHRTFTNYRTTKCRLFKQANFSVINADDPSASWFKRASSSHTTYGIKQGTVRATNIKLSTSGVSYNHQNTSFKLHLPGEFNVYNSLAAICVGEKLGLTKQTIQQGFLDLDAIEGRMNRLDCGQPFEVIVDYAHTPDAIQKVFDSVKNHSGRIISVHGGAGRRDESTRATRGQILAQHSDVVIITEDDSRDENPEKIAAEFVKGAESAGKTLGQDLFVVLDRQKAIAKALQTAHKGDLVLILGKGHEKTILRADGPHDFEDLIVTQKLLKQLVKKSQKRPKRQ